MLEDYRSWDRRNGDKSSWTFLKRLFEAWGIDPIDWSITGEGEVQRLDGEKPIASRVCNEAAIAVAFAVLKMRASCPADVAGLARSALIRTSFLVEANTFDNDVKDAWDVAIGKLRAKFDSLPRSRYLENLDRFEDVPALGHPGDGPAKTMFEFVDDVLKQVKLNLGRGLKRRAIPPASRQDRRS